MERPSVEQQIFTWQNWDEGDTNDLVFYDVELLVPVGEFPVGTKFNSAYWMGSDSLIVFEKDHGQEFVYELKVAVGEKVDPSTLVVDTKFTECSCGHNHD